MRLLAPLIILGAALAALLLTPAATPILGLAHQAFAGAATLTALLVYLLRMDAGLRHCARRRLARALGDGSRRADRRLHVQV
jgi:hypothetical protein